MMQSGAMIVTRKPSGKYYEGLLSFHSFTFPCLLGKGGITTHKREGDGATPTGTYEILYGFYRRDRVGILSAQIPMTAINETMGWCDEPASPNYNQPVTLPFSPSHEQMMREDRLYDICLVLDYNLNQRIRNRGSAIFFHLTSPQGKPTQGCIALEPRDMRFVLERIKPGGRITVKP